MPYQKHWKPGRDFAWVVDPFIGQLPETAWQDPLRLKYPPGTYNKVTWNWYNWMQATCPGDYQIKLQQDTEEGMIIAISRRLAKVEVLGNEPLPENVDPDELNDIIRQFKEKTDGET